MSLSSAGVEDVAGYFSCQKIQLFGSKSEFQQLNYEETLSETRLNCTADLAGVVTSAKFSFPSHNCVEWKSFYEVEIWVLANTPMTWQHLHTTP